MNARIDRFQINRDVVWSLLARETNHDARLFIGHCPAVEEEEAAKRKVVRADKPQSRVHVCFVGFNLDSGGVASRHERNALNASTKTGKMIVRACTRARTRAFVSLIR